MGWIDIRLKVLRMQLQINHLEKEFHRMTDALSDLKTVVARVAADIQAAVAAITNHVAGVAETDVEAQVAALNAAAAILEGAVNPPTITAAPADVVAAPVAPAETPAA